MTTINGFTPEEEEQILVASCEAKKGNNVSENMNSKQAIDYLAKLSGSTS